MIGGDLLATGSSSCIFKPSLPCVDKKKRYNNKVSKIVYGEKSIKYYNKEKNIAKILKSIKGSNKWCIISEMFCKPPLYDNIFNLDNDILSCKDREYEKIFDESSKMIISKYGGITFEDYFIDNLLNDKSLKNIEIQMYKLFYKMKYLFIGLKEIYKNKIIHLDIKYNNIVLDGKFFKYIDFGLSSQLNDLDHFKQRSLSEFNSNRLYIWYPTEYLYLFLDDFDKKQEIIKLSNNKRKHLKTISKIHKLFNVDYEQLSKNLLDTTNKYSKKEHYKLLSMIDIYSLGIIIPFLFVDYSLYSMIYNSEFLLDLFILFKEMCKINYKERISPDGCIKRYNEIIKKYDYLGTKKGKKTKKK